MRRGTLRRGVVAGVVAGVAGLALAGQALAAPAPVLPTLPTLTPSPFPVAAPSSLPLPPPTIPDERFAPLDRPGPELDVPPADLDASLRCTANAKDADTEVVLFVPGTTLTPTDEAVSDQAVIACSLENPESCEACQ